MKLIQEKQGGSPTVGREHFVDMETVRRRVARIKNGWSPEVTRARAIEGQRRRRELESIMLDLICDTTESEESCDLAEYGFSLVG